MIVRSRSFLENEIPSHLRWCVELQHAESFRRHEGYVVYGISHYRSAFFLLVVDDLDTLIFMPAFEFEGADATVPQGWIVNLSLGHGVEMVAGPRWVAESYQSYTNVLEEEAATVDRFWTLVDTGELPYPHVDLKEPLR